MGNRDASIFNVASQERGVSARQTIYDQPGFIAGWDREGLRHLAQDALSPCKSHCLAFKLGHVASSDAPFLLLSPWQAPQSPWRAAEASFHNAV